MKNKALAKAIKVAGGLTALANQLGISKQAVNVWDKCPPQHALSVEKITGITRYELRPDIFGAAP